MLLNFMKTVPAAWFISALGIVICIAAQAKIEQDLKSANAMPNSKWWQARSIGHLSKIVVSHRTVSPKSLWRSIWALGIALFFAGFFWMLFSKTQ